MIYNKGKQILRWMPLWFIRCVGGNDLNFKMFFITKFETAWVSAERTRNYVKLPEDYLVDPLVLIHDLSTCF